MNPRPVDISRSSDEPMIERIAQEMAEQWRCGSRPLAEAFLDQYPELWLHPDDALELIAEELALCADYDCPISPSKLTARFPQWSQQVLALLDCQRVLGSHPLAPRFPEPGETLDGFRLVSELGRGGHGRVFLATQPTLAGRPVVLKLSPDSGSEHIALARLQHTHIVPLYSAHEFPERGLRGMCMPYFGGSTMAAIQTNLKNLRLPPAGRDFLTTPLASEPFAQGPAWEFLNRATFEEAICWIGACLADALQFAHDRGILHLDLKPSNILIAGDGVPMLLDFHLARAPLQIGDMPPAWLGGTPGYMAPEQSFALDAVRDVRPIAKQVDGRADIYALGILLRELLRGPVSSGLTDILGRCTAPVASVRYASASDLASDFRRQLGDLPLKGVRNRSLSERLGKWRRRRPYALPLALALGTILAAGAGFYLHVKRSAERARTALNDARYHLDRGRYQEAVEGFRGGETLLEGLPFYRDLKQELHDGHRDAERGKTAVDLHAFCDQVRPFYDEGLASPEESRRVWKQCRKLWDRRDSLVEKLTGQKAPALERQWRADLLDLAILVSCLEDRTTSRTQSANGHRAALATLDRAEQLLGESAALLLERARHARALGQEAVANEATRRGQAFPSSTPWEHLAAGRVELATGDLERASRELDRCVSREPRFYWAQYYKGVCELRQNRPLEAIAALSAAAALAPDAAPCLYNRGLAFTESGRFDSALADFDRAISLDPSLGVCYLGRSAAQFRAGRYPEALIDLDRAAASGLDPAEELYRKALVHNASGDRPAAIACLKGCLQAEPDRADAKELLAKLNPKR